MTVHKDECLTEVQAAADLTVAGSQYKVINLGGTIAAAADKARFAGILKHGATSGYLASAVYDGFTKGYVGGAVSTPGWPLKVANSGFLVACASGDIAAVARFWPGHGTTTAASGDIAPVLADFDGAPGYWGG